MIPGRRSFLIACLGALGATGLGTWWLGRSTPQLASSECLRLLLPRSRQVIAMGGWYLRHAPPSAQASALSEQVFDGRAFRDVEGCAEFLRGRIRRDYEQGATREVNGFVVAETELRLYALARGTVR